MLRRAGAADRACTRRAAPRRAARRRTGSPWVPWARAAVTGTATLASWAAYSGRILRAGPRDHAEAPPVGVARLEDLFEAGDRRGVALFGHGAGVGDLDRGPVLRDLPGEHEHALQDVDGLEARDDARHVILVGEEPVGGQPDDGRHVAGQDEAVDLHAGVVDQRAQRLGHGLVHRERGEVVEAFRIRGHDRAPRREERWSRSRRR